MPLGTNCVMVHNEHHTMSMLIVFLQVEIFVIMVILLILVILVILMVHNEQEHHTMSMLIVFLQVISVIFLLDDIPDDIGGRRGKVFFSWESSQWQSLN